MASAKAQAPLSAFPGAEGFGASATGGRGGPVIKVTNLNTDGPGSLQEALNQPGPRIVVFDVSGEIHGDVTIQNGDVTIAGQTAPGGGITIRGRLYGRYQYGVDNIIIRHLRVRPPIAAQGAEPGEEYDAIQFSRNARVILDHISASWAVDETVDFYSAKDATLQWSTIEESLTEGHPKGRHNYGFISGDSAARISVHHNLFAHHLSRAPAMAAGPAEVINNLIYNVTYAFVHHNAAKGPFNILGNYYRRGREEIYPFNFESEGPTGPGLAYFLRDNCVDDPGNFTGAVDNPWQPPPKHFSFKKEHLKGDGYRVDDASDFTRIGMAHIPVTHQSCKDILNLVLEKAGGFPRDAVTLRTISEVRDRTGSWGAKAPPNLMEGLKPSPPPKDSDNDGMPDPWETAHGLDPQNSKDHGKAMPSGYTAIEEYINELADKFAGGMAAPPGPMLSNEKKNQVADPETPSQENSRARLGPASIQRAVSEPGTDDMAASFSVERREPLPPAIAIPILVLIGLITQPPLLFVVLALGGFLILRLRRKWKRRSRQLP